MGHDDAMLHVRLIVPPHLRPPVTARLDGDATVCNLTVLVDGARQPDGDLVLFDIPLESANALLDDLKAFDLHRHGTISLHRVDTTLSDASAEAERLAHGSPGEAVIWEEVARKVGMEARLSVSFLAFLVVATLIGAIAVLTDSPVLVIGAMLVGPEFGPLAALMLAVQRRRWADAGQAATTLTVGFALAGVTSLLFTAVLRALDRVPAESVSGTIEFTRFISHPDVFSVLVALLSGVAGVLSLTEGKAGTLVGVLISVTTLPALANVGVASALGDGEEAMGALVQLGVNVGCLLVAGVATLWVQERLLRRHGEVAVPAPT